MKKNFLFASLLIASVLATAVSAADPTILWDFTADEAISESMSNATQVEYSGTTVDGVECYNFVATDADPHVNINIGTDSVDDVVWCKVRAKNACGAGAIELFGATNGRSLAGSECTHVDLSSDTDNWYTYLIYIPTENVRTVNAYKQEKYHITDPYWEGTVEYIRLDPMWKEGDDGNDAGGSMTADENIYIDYVAFFSNQEDAFAFRADQDNYAFEDQAPVVETEPETVAAPEADATETVAAPQTFDVAVVATIAATVSAAGYAISKKR